MLRFKEESFESILEEVKPLLQQHWEELANHKDIRPLDPAYDRYIELNRLGIVRICTVRDDDKLVGYAAFVISNHLHYQTWKSAVCDVYYLHPNYRKTDAAMFMFTNMEEWLKSMDVQGVMIQDKVNHSHGKLFDKLGYKLTENIYERVY